MATVHTCIHLALCIQFNSIIIVVIIIFAGWFIYMYCWYGSSIGKITVIASNRCSSSSIRNAC